MRFLGIIILVASPALASDCPPPPDHAAAILQLVEDIHAAPNEAAARDVSTQLWEYWADAPDERAQEMLDTGMAKRRAYNFLGALSDLNRLVAYCPDYAEGYNQRAFVNFLRQDFAAALPDLERSIELSPTHIGALSGRALTLFGLGREAEAQDALARALELNPWLPERSLVKPPERVAPSGEEL